MEALLMATLEKRAKVIEQIFHSNYTKPVPENTLQSLLFIKENSEFLTGAYRMVLGHAPDEAGYAHYLPALSGQNKVMRRCIVLARLYFSREGLRRLAGRKLIFRLLLALRGAMRL
jgi:hypothetical protein